MKKYINLSLCGNIERVLDESELDTLELGFYKDEIVANVKDKSWNDWCELVFLLEESVPVPVDLDTIDIYNMICSWCVNVAFGGLDCYDARSTLEDVASQLDRIDKGDEFRMIADLNYLRFKFADLSWDCFMPDYIPDDSISGFESMNEEELEEARDEMYQAHEEYAIYEYLRDLNQPFGVYKDAEMLLKQYLSGEESTKSTWY